MTINNNNEHTYILAFKVQSTSTAIFATSSHLFCFLNNIAINIRHDMTFWYCPLSTWLKAIEKAKSAGQQSLALLWSQSSKRLSSCNTWPSEKSNQDLKMTWKHPEAVKWNVFCWTFFWWMKLMIKVFFKGSAGQHKNGTVSVLSGRPPTSADHRHT